MDEEPSARLQESARPSHPLRVWITLAAPALPISLWSYRRLGWARLGLWFAAMTLTSSLLVLPMLVRLGRVTTDEAVHHHWAPIGAR
jgi:hypothetical protein